MGRRGGELRCKEEGLYSQRPLLQAATLSQAPSIPAVSHGALGDVGGQNFRPVSQTEVLTLQLSLSTDFLPMGLPSQCV